MVYPEPEPGLVISYSYLWSEEAAAGHAEGRKNRPCAILLVIQTSKGKSPGVTVAPITHSPPDDPGVAIEIPTRVNRHLGLDSERSWVILEARAVATEKAGHELVRSMETTSDSRRRAAQKSRE